MIPADRVFTRARWWFARGTDHPQRRLGTWLCAKALGEDAGPLPEIAAPQAGIPSAPVTREPLGLLRADPAQLRRLASQIEAGPAPDRVPAPLLAAWRTALPVAVTLAVRAHDLALTAALLRAGARLDCAEHPLLREATAFLAAQQQPDGGFGALAADADPALRDAVRLPLTLGCVWALAECAWMPASHRHV